VSKSDLHDFELYVRAETEKAILVSDGTRDAEGKEKRFWLPLSQIEREKNHKDGTEIITMPEWLAIEKELV
jgi:hypothetical protein